MTLSSQSRKPSHKQRRRGDRALIEDLLAEMAESQRQEELVAEAQYAHDMKDWYSDRYINWYDDPLHCDQCEDIDSDDGSADDDYDPSHDDRWEWENL